MRKRFLTIHRKKEHYAIDGNTVLVSPKETEVELVKALEGHCIFLENYDYEVFGSSGFDNVILWTMRA